MTPHEEVMTGMRKKFKTRFSPALSEKPAADKLKLLLHNLDLSIEVANTIGTIEEAVNWFQSSPLPDLILMDIQLSDGLCFEIFDVVRISTPIIFTTAFDDYAIRAFKLNSIDYLLKPVNGEDLNTALIKYRSLFPTNPAQNEKINRVYESFAKSYRTRFLVKVGLRYNSIAVDEIECFYINGHCTFLRTFAGKNFDLDSSLEQLQTMISPDQFFRINRNCIVNIRAITEIISYSSNRLKVELKNKSGEEWIVSREKVTEFKEWLNR